MEILEALESIKEMWNDDGLDLGTKILEITDTFYNKAKLKFAETVEFINATPSEFDALLTLGGLDEDLIKKIAAVDPPKTTWSLFANASEEEIKQALKVLESRKGLLEKEGTPLSALVYQQMLEVAGPTREQLVGMLSSFDLYHVLSKSENFKALNEWETKFFKSICAQKKRGKVLTPKQIESLINILNNIVDKGVIKRNSIDGDIDICDRVLDALGK